MEVLRNSVSGAQPVEERLGLLQIARVEAFGEPAVDRSEKLACLIPLALIAPELDAALVRWTPRETQASPPVRQMCRSRYIRVNTN
jgi:hypothetical protein